MQKTDAAVMLKEEVGESLKRVRAAKFGHKLHEIAPQHAKSYYLPDRSQFQVKKQKHVDPRYSLKSQDETRRRNRGDSMALPPSSQHSHQRGAPHADDPLFLTQSHQSLRTQTSKQPSILVSHDYRLMKANRHTTYNLASAPGTTRNQAAIFFSPRADRREQQRVFKRTLAGIKRYAPTQPAQLNEISRKFEDKYGPVFESEPALPSKMEEEVGPADQVKDVQFVSAIDSKPICPGYLKLLTFDEFLKDSKENDGSNSQSSSA